MKKRIHIIEEVGNKTTWVLSIGSKAPWSNRIQFPIPEVIAKWLLRFSCHTVSTPIRFN